MLSIQTVESYETAARRFCELTGVNPDQQVPVAGDIVGNMMTMVHRTRPMWMTVAQQMQQTQLMFDCMKDTSIIRADA